MATALGADAGLAQIALRSVGEPGVGALLVEELNDGVERGVVHDLLAAVGACVTGDSTPQLRWRLMHQSGRCSTMAPMRLAA